MKYIQTFENFLTEERIKSNSDHKFIEKIEEILRKAGLKTVLHPDGVLTITGEDDEKVNLEYQY